MQVLVITTPPDPHVDMVVEKLDRVELVIFNPSDYPFEQVSYNADKTKTVFQLGRVTITEPDVVWFRKPRLLYSSDLPVDDEYRRYVHDAYKRFSQLLYGLFPSSLWVSNPWHIFAADNKVRQLGLARQLGLKIPETLVTSSVTEAMKFRKRIGDIVIKPIGTEFVVVDDEALAFYTTVVKQDEELDLEGLNMVPTIFQRHLQNHLDIRVTVIDNKVYPCSIRKKPEVLDKPDWRELTDGKELTYEAHPLPAEISTLCIQMVGQLGLLYGAFDFMLNEHTGEYWFLEVNPNGQWAFIEDESGLAISQGFADLFSSKI